MRVLIIRFSSIGDIISTTALPRVVKNTVPDAKLDYLTSLEYMGLIKESPHIDDILVLNRRFSRFMDLLSLAKEIKKRRYDVIVDAHNTLRSRVISFINNDTPIIRFSKHRLKRFLLLNFRINLLKNIPLNVVRHGNALASLGIPYDNKGTEIYTGEEVKKQVREKLKNIKNYIVLVPGGAWPKKQWPKNNFIELAKKLSRYKKILVLGAEKDRLFTHKVDGIYDYSGKLTLMESIEALRGAELIVGNDTGLMHAGEALSRPIMIILGPTGREFGMYPFRKDSQAIELDMWCRPCSSYGKGICIRGGRPCLKNISVDLVFGKILSFLKIKDDDFFLS